MKRKAGGHVSLPTFFNFSFYADLSYPSTFQDSITFIIQEVQEVCQKLSLLEELYEQKYNLFEEFPDHFLRKIDWDKLDFVSPHEVHRIIHTRLTQWQDKELREEERIKYTLKEVDLAEARDNVSGCRYKAEQAIDRVLREIRKYEDKWMVPEPGT